MAASTTGEEANRAVAELGQSVPVGSHLETGSAHEAYEQDGASSQGPNNRATLREPYDGDEDHGLEDSSEPASSITRRSTKLPSTPRLPSEEHGALAQEAEFYNRKALERAVIGEASEGSTLDWSLVDVPPGTYSVTLKGIGGGSQVITWQMHNGARRSRFVADDFEFSAFAGFPDPRADEAADPQDLQPRSDGVRRTSDSIEDFLESQPEVSQSRPSLSPGHVRIDEVPIQGPTGDSVEPSDEGSHGDASHVSPEVPHVQSQLTTDPSPHQASSDGVASRSAHDSLEGEHHQDRLLPPAGVSSTTPHRALRFKPPSEETVSAYIGHAAVRAATSVPWTPASADIPPHSPSHISSEHEPAPNNETQRSPRPFRYGSGADFSSESELNPEDSISRAARPNSAVSYRQGDLSNSRGHRGGKYQERFNPRHLYRGFVFFAPENHLLQDIDEDSWEHVRRLRIPLHDREVYNEAMQRTGTGSKLEQLLALPSDFLRERVAEEIGSAATEGARLGKVDLDEAPEWFLLGVCLEYNKMMLFLSGIPNATLSSSRSAGFGSNSPSDDQVHDFRQRKQPTNGDDISTRNRSRLTPEPTGPGASVDDLLSLTGAPSSVSVYRPTLNIPNRYPVSDQRHARQLRGRNAIPQQVPEIGTGTANLKAVLGTGTPSQRPHNTSEQDVATHDFGNHTVTAPKSLTRSNRKKSQDRESAIHFTDAVGRNFTFPWHMAQTFSGFRDLVETASASAEDIMPEVSKGHYDLLGPDQRVILPKLWEDLVEPGWHITMRMRTRESDANLALPLPSTKIPQQPRRTTIAGSLDDDPKVAGSPHVDTVPTSSVDLDRVDSIATKYVPTSPFSTQTHSSAGIPRYFSFVQKLKSHVPHLINVLATECRNPSGGKISCWDTLRAGGKPVLVRQVAPQNSRSGRIPIDFDPADLPPANVKLRTIIVEDLSPQLVECIGTALWPNPEFFEEHLSCSGYQGVEAQVATLKKWPAGAASKGYISIKWHRPVERNQLKPHSPQEHQEILSLEQGTLKWTASPAGASYLSDGLETGEDVAHSVSVETNIFRRCWPLTATSEAPGAIADCPTTAVWEERATLFHTRVGSCPVVVILVDPIPRVCHLSQALSEADPTIRSRLLYQQVHNRNSVGSSSITLEPHGKDDWPSQQRSLIQSHVNNTKSTATDMMRWLDEAAHITPDNPDVTVVTALLWVIHRDTIGFMHLVSNVLEEIGLKSTDDMLVRTHLPHWRALISRFQVELPELRTTLEAFARLAQELNPVEPQQSIVSEFIPDTLTQIDILIEQNEKSYAALRADMGVLESRKAIAEAESVGKLTELAFIFIPLTFITGAFSMQIEELQTPAPIYAFVVASIVALTLAYATRLTMRSDSVTGWVNSHNDLVRIHAGLPAGSPVPALTLLTHTLRYCDPTRLWQLWQLKRTKRTQRRGWWHRVRTRNPKEDWQRSHDRTDV